MRDVLGKFSLKKRENSLKMLLLGNSSLKNEEYACLYAKQKKIREDFPNYDHVMLKVQNIREDFPNYLKHRISGGCSLKTIYNIRKHQQLLNLTKYPDKTPHTPQQ
ncbi:hypothetical protein BSK67_19860, partial [Paenibacillus odorifer]